MKDMDQALAAVAVGGAGAKHGGRVFQGIPGIETTGGGVLWATWYGGGDDEGPDNFAMLAGSRDGGDTWSGVERVVDPPGRVRAYDPGLWRSDDGRLFWFWSQSYDKFDGRAGVWMAEARGSGAAVEWGTPVRVGNGVMMNKPTVLRDGTWMLPIAVWNMRTMSSEEPPAFYEPMAGERFSNLLASRDRGRTYALQVGPDVAVRSFDEHMVVERQDGVLVLFVRTHYGIGARISDDRGRTWRHWVDTYSTHDVFRTGPSTRFFVRKLPSGRWLMVYHEHMRLRCNLTAYLSEDEGRTWSDGLLLDERPNVSYPDGTVDADGAIHVIYDRGRYAARQGAMEILTARFTEKDILARRIVDSGSRLRTVVNAGGR
jgi:hypothetical protein